jgi:hypothetical protein
MNQMAKKLQPRESVASTNKLFCRSLGSFRPSSTRKEHPANIDLPRSLWSVVRMEKNASLESPETDPHVHGDTGRYYPSHETVEIFGANARLPREIETSPHSHSTD